MVNLRDYLKDGDKEARAMIHFKSSSLDLSLEISFPQSIFIVNFYLETQG